jgi:hypothetical protein
MKARRYSGRGEAEYEVFADGTRWILWLPDGSPSGSRYPVGRDRPLAWAIFEAATGLTGVPWSPI